MTTMTSSRALYSILFLLPSALCHMEMSWPYPLHSKYNPNANYQTIDYSMTSPLDADGSNFPCKGYQNDRPIHPVVTYAAGSTYNMTLAGSATHLGGSCQISLSYDNGATFRVIKSMIGGCPLTSTYDFTVPSYAPAGEALLAWTWQNHDGNREFYMNCAEVSITTASSKRRRRRQVYNSFESLPYLFKANLEGLNDCSTTENENPVYPNPGPDVVYGDGMDADSPAFQGDCDSPTPYGQTYRAMGDSDESSMSLSGVPMGAHTTTREVAYAPYEPASFNGPTSTSTAAVSLSAPVRYASASETPTPEEHAYGDDDEDKAQVAFSVSSLASYAQHRVAAPTTSSGLTIASSSTADDLSPTPSTTTVTMTIDCPDTVLVTITMPQTTTQTTEGPSMYYTSVPPSACTATEASCPCADGYGCKSIGVCAWQCQLTSTPSPSASSSEPPAVTATLPPTNYPPFSASSTRTGVGSTPTGTAAESGSPGTNRPAYATGDLDRYLPCVPGTFICTSATEFYTCNYAQEGSSEEWAYGYPRDVADGMECLTNLAPYSDSTTQYKQQGQTSAGYYRDDRYVRARPDGDCNEEGSILCTEGGSAFDVCDQGGWVPMGAVAEGTQCRNGEIVAS
ncbi:hypothetical protein KC315_g13266 [Hortaea werneckii]|nr:hypothetical protein KC342_g10771 [Hortaea werneckii]KAI7092321.1 hypothetical protein KC339_g12445 [Hortaea werneckii]KAI7218332.1 hypothetical protein KC365_g12668 [Hortaea werneckii]KAI7308683.1 hypothetical protein KC315_g13266 [Hortaea werneckii]KAI7325031.1 hypothetical protein KC340_g6197 [Hortaea werneckii]